MFGKIENAAQIETGGDVLAGVDFVSIPFNEEGDQVQHVSLTVMGSYFNQDTHLVATIEFEGDPVGLVSGITIFTAGETPNIKTIEFNAKHWSLQLFDGSPANGGPGTILAYEYTITYPPSD